MEIDRTHYLNRLISKKHNGLVKIITGIRRCGKSYLLNTIFYRHLLASGIPEDHIIRFAFDSARDLLEAGESLLDLSRKSMPADPEKFLKYISSRLTDDGMYYLLLDEVQMLGSFEAVLNGYLRMDNVDIYVTGSNARFLSGDIVTEFAGRGDDIRMYPLCFSEFMSVYPGDRYDGLNQYMLYGGIPLVVLQDDPAEKARMLKNLFDEIYIRDIIKRHNIRNGGEFEDLLNILSSSVGSLTNPERLKNTFHSIKTSKITAGTIKKYLGYFEDSFLTEAAERYDIKGKSYIGTSKKYYFTDSGLRNARLNFRQFEKNHTIENIIYNELRMRGFNVDVGIVPIAEKDKKGSVRHKQLEVDFICNLGDKKYYVQSAYSIPDEDKRAQELRPLCRISDSFKKFIVTGDIVPSWYDESGILTVSIYDFLLDPGIIEG